jgi:hypothetical protein
VSVLCISDLHGSLPECSSLSQLVRFQPKNKIFSKYDYILRSALDMEREGKGEGARGRGEQGKKKIVRKRAWQ